MPELGDLYQSLILDHSRSPRNYGAPPASPVPGTPAAGYGFRSADGNNPMCGDTVRVWVAVEGDRVADVRFTGKGCAISQASASLMTTAVKGKTRAEADRIFERFHDMVTGKPLDDDARAALGKLVAFGGVSRFPMRVKCASLGWHAMRAALHGDAPRVSTE
ncbi:MAG TPA: SUF system NifU family Fe-S cluster assembly protein, partial [Gemmatimonadaceae bacterium]|nr:SUF system NifU family Fe-S cluster assembly protein [Gemmatimonadaceae bacterium]